MATTPSNLNHLRNAVPASLVTASSRVTTVTPIHQVISRASLLTLAKEPEDARLTGGTRSLDRRLLALNLSRPSVKPATQDRIPAIFRPSAA